MVLGQIILASAAVSLISLIGLATFSLKDRLLHSLLFIFVSFASGAMISAAFFHILPESIAAIGAPQTLQLTVVGMLVFFVLEKFLYWHHHHKHHHKGDKDEPPFTYLNLMGGTIHNFVDGTVIAASFMASPATGIISTFAIISHEIPHEIGDFSLLIYGGFSRRKALIFNFISALAAMLGSLMTFFLLPLIPNITSILLPLAAGNFIYVACVDIVPEMHKERDGKKSVVQFVALLFGIALIMALGKLVEG